MDNPVDTSLQFTDALEIVEPSELGGTMELRFVDVARSAVVFVSSRCSRLCFSEKSMPACARLLRAAIEKINRRVKGAISRSELTTIDERSLVYSICQCPLNEVLYSSGDNDR